jgi:hypothetical protein
MLSPAGLRARCSPDAQTLARKNEEGHMAKGTEKPQKNNKPKLSTKDKQKKKKEKAASGGK